MQSIGARLIVRPRSACTAGRLAPRGSRADGCPGLCAGCLAFRAGDQRAPGLARLAAFWAASLMQLVRPVAIVQQIEKSSLNRGLVRWAYGAGARELAPPRHHNQRSENKGSSAGVCRAFGFERCNAYRGKCTKSVDARITATWAA